MVKLFGSKTIRFKRGRAASKPALALVYDLAGFSAFANQPDAAQWVPRFFTHVSEAIQVVIYGGYPYWLDTSEHYDPLEKPKHQKFLGDGALYIWTGTSRKALPQLFINQLCLRLRDLRANFPEVVAAAQEKVQVPQMPKEIRFGMALGDVYELSRTDTRQREYVGICINLASRLQKYCPGMGFIGARVQMLPSFREKYGFERRIAKNIDGFPTEFVVVDSSEYKALDGETRQKYFSRVT